MRAILELGAIIELQKQTISDLQKQVEELTVIGFKNDEEILKLQKQNQELKESNRTIADNYASTVHRLAIENEEMTGRHKALVEGLMIFRGIPEIDKLLGGV